MLDESPEGRDVACHGSVHASHPPKAARHNHRQLCEKEAEMTCDLFRERERTRRRVLWALATLQPGDSNAPDLLAILDDLDDQERNDYSFSGKPLELIEVRNSVSVMRHNSGIDIILEQTIPQPWRERFHQASIGSTRVPDGPYATDWDKFLTEWQREMQHVKNHRAAQAAAS